MATQFTFNSIDGGGESLVLPNPLRLLQGTRVCGAATQDGQSVFVKAFYHPTRARAHASREANHARMLLSRGFPTPQVLSESTGMITGPDVSMRRAHVVVFKFLSPGTTLAQKLASSDSPSIVLKAAWDLMKRLDSKGFSHTDPHLSNFVYSDETLYLVDCSTIKHHRPPFSWFRQRMTIPLFLSQFDPTHDTELQALSGQDWEPIESLRIVGRKRFMAKVLRPCSRIHVESDLLVTRALMTDEMMLTLKGETEGLQQIRFDDTKSARIAWATAHYLGEKIANIRTPLALRDNVILLTNTESAEQPLCSLEPDIESLSRRLAQFHVTLSADEIQGICTSCPDGPRVDPGVHLRFD